MEELYDLRELDQAEGVTYGEIRLQESYFASMIMVHRPHVKNALDLNAINAFSAFAEQIVNAPSVKRIATIIYGVGGSFISGGDLKALHQNREAAAAKEMSRLMRRALHELRSLPGLLVMVADGPIIGGGAEVFISGDFRFISSRSVLRFAQSTLGLSTGWGGGRRLSQILGRSEALALLLDAELLSAERCHQLKLAHRVVEPDRALSEAVEWLKEQSKRPQALFGIKRMLRNDEFEEIDKLEAELFPTLWTSHEHWTMVDELWKKREVQQSHVKTESFGQEELNLTQSSQSSLNHQQAQLVNKTRGLFVVLEGIDGAGTTTQAERIVASLLARGRVAHITQEPSGGIIGTLTRRALRGETIGIDQRPLPAESIALLFAADRADHWHNEIEPRLERGEDVICDRYLYSSLAYQGIELPESWVRSLNQLFPQPDLLLFVEVSVDVSAARRASRGQEADRYEVDELQRQIAIRYQKICREFQGQVIDGEMGIEEVTNACLEALSPLLKVSKKMP